MKASDTKQNVVVLVIMLSTALLVLFFYDRTTPFRFPVLYGIVVVAVPDL
jgi:hypothetical protein